MPRPAPASERGERIPRHRLAADRERDAGSRAERRPAGRDGGLGAGEVDRRDRRETGPGRRDAEALRDARDIRPAFFGDCAWSGPLCRIAWSNSSPAWGSASRAVRVLAPAD